ncbi:MAG: hypothetical protein MUC90_05870 [Thermoplasmata archaeon]|nr:hypothetical protein [Thermoplasmata archaeon]
MEDPKKGTEFICGVCGTTLVVTEEGVGILEDVVCCEKPMDVVRGSPRKAKAKKKVKKPRKKR